MMRIILEKYSILIFILIIPLKIFAIGYGEWIYETRFGNIIEGVSGVKLFMKNQNRELANLDRWYFYEEHIIGIFETNRYFIANELSGEIRVYKRESKWREQIKREKLNPKVWINWRRNHFSLPHYCLIGLYLSPVLILLIGLTSRIAYKSIAEEKLNLKRKNTQVFFVISLIVIYLLIKILMIGSI